MAESGDGKSESFGQYLQKPIDFIVRYAEILLLTVAFRAAGERFHSGPVRAISMFLAAALFYHVAIGMTGAALQIRRMFPHPGGSRRMWAWAVGMCIFGWVTTLGLLLSVFAAIDQLAEVGR